MQSPSSTLGPIRYYAKERRSKQIATEKQGIRTSASEQHGFQQPCPIPGVPGSTFPAQGDLTTDISGEGDQHFTVPSFGSFEHPKPEEKLPETTESRDVAVALCSKGDTTMANSQVDFQETEVCLDFKEEYKYVKRFSGSFSSIQGDFMADGLDQLTLCSQSLGFGTPAAPVQ
ncbi:hypothetical protein STEG23_030597, partial [Scotinomys teguina]